MKQFQHLFRIHISTVEFCCGETESSWQWQCITFGNAAHNMVWHRWTVEWGYPSCLLDYKMIFRVDYRTARRNTVQGWIRVHVLYKRVLWHSAHTSAHSLTAHYCTRRSNAAKPIGYKCVTAYVHNLVLYVFCHSKHRKFLGKTHLFWW